MKDKDFIDWCFHNLDGTEDKYDLGHLLWVKLTKENLRLARKLARLEKILEEFKLSVEAAPTPSKRTE